LVAIALRIASAPTYASVHVNQVGYLPADPKHVEVAGAATTFEVRDAASGAPLFTGSLALRRTTDPASGDDVYEGDFSAFTTPGLFTIHVPGVGDSPPFCIDPGLYDALYRDLIRGLYYQRCGTAIPAAYGGAWTHDTCHASGPSIASFDWSTTGGAPGSYRNTIGGWHDAGDYGKYTTNNAYTVGILLQAYEQFPGRFPHDDCGIPESGNGVPDILDETRWSLEWMLTMQDPDGKVRHRESIPDWSDEFIPENDPNARYYTDESSDGTAVHCAAMALAARVFAPIDPAFAAACSTSAAGAWSWLLAHPDRVPAGGFVNLYGHNGATYILGSEAGRRFWAAAEIFRLTGAAEAQGFVDAHWGEGAEFSGVWYPDSWGDVANMGAFTYRDAPGATAPVVAGSWWSIENSVISSADQWTTRWSQDGYRCVAASSGTYGDYYWGFTGVLLRYAWTLLQAERYDGDPAREDVARDQLHYVLGRNPMGKVYVTGLGTNPVLHSHGAWNLAAGYVAIEDSLCHPVPYQLVGGPNQADNPDISPYPARCYEDIADPDYYYKGNWTLNETSINIQASLIVLAGYFSSGGVATSVSEIVAGDPGPAGAAPPRSLHLAGARPNPFNPTTTIAFFLPTSSRTSLRLYDIRGRLVQTLCAEELPPGGHAYPWDGRDTAGRPSPSGVYFVRLTSSDEVLTKKIVLAR